MYPVNEAVLACTHSQLLKGLCHFANVHCQHQCEFVKKKKNPLVDKISIAGQAGLTFSDSYM